METKNSTVQLVEGAVRGNRDCLSKLITELFPKINKIVAYRMKNNADSEDVTQEILVKICEKIGTLREAKAYKTWVDCILRNELRQYWRRNKKHNDMLFSDDILLEKEAEKNPLMLPQEHLAETENQVVKKHECEMLFKLIDRLSPKQRTLVILHHFQKLSVTETGKATDTKQPNVSRELKKAYEKIRTQLAKTN